MTAIAPIALAAASPSGPVGLSLTRQKLPVLEGTEGERAIDIGAMVLLSPFGFSPTGEAFNLTMEEVATSVAISIQADKLIFLTEIPGIRIDSELPESEDNPIDTELPLAAAEKLLASLPPPQKPTDTAFYLQHCVKACKAGVERNHILPFALDGSLLLEVYVHDGVGTMVIDEKLESLREATVDDIGGILQLIEPFERDGTLPAGLDAELIDRDGRVFLRRECPDHGAIEALAYWFTDRPVVFRLRMSLLFGVIVFLVLMNKILFKPLIQFMDARDKGIRDNLEEAAGLRQLAESALTAYESAIGAARRDMAEQTAAVQRAMDAKQREQIEQARNEAHTLVAEAQATITHETQEARNRLVDAARELARLVVAKLMGREATR